MHDHELDGAVSVWREANVARGALHGPQRTERIRAKLSAPDALPFVALRPAIVGMALAEPGRSDGGAGELEPSLLHISMVFVRPAAQRTGAPLQSSEQLQYEGLLNGEEDESRREPAS